MRFLFGASPSPVHVDYRERVGRPVGMKDHGRLVGVLPQMQLQRMTVLCDVGAIGASILINVGVRFHVRIQHGFVDARITALVTSERLRPIVISEMVLQMVLVFRYERASGAAEPLVFLDVLPGMPPELHLGDGDEIALLAFKLLHFTVRIELGGGEIYF